MDVVKIVGLVTVALAFSGGMGWLGYALWKYLMEPDARTELKTMLRASGLAVSPEAWRVLHGRAKRRNRWAAIGAGVGFGLGFLVSLPFSAHGNGSDLLAGAGGFVGAQFGQALSSQFGVPHRDGAVRASGLQPHDLLDYLRLREIVGECACVLCGLALTAGGVAALLLGTATFGSTSGWLVVALGLFVLLVSAGAVASQWRLVHSPMLAEGEAGLVSNDITLMSGLRDLTLATAMALFWAWWALVCSMGLPWWQEAVGLAVGIGVIPLLFGPLRPAYAMPVAQRFAGIRPASPSRW